MFLPVKDDHWPVNHLIILATLKIRVVFQIYAAEWLLWFRDPISVYVGQSSLKRMQVFNPPFCMEIILAVEAKSSSD